MQTVEILINYAVLYKSVEHANLAVLSEIYLPKPE